MHFFYLLLLSLCVALSGCQGLTAGVGNKPAAASGPALNRRCPDLLPLDDQTVARSIDVSVERLTALKTYRSLTNNDICTMPDAALKRAFARLDKPKADHPGEWAEFRNKQRRSEDGKVKPDGLIKGIEHRKEMLRKLHEKQLAAEKTTPENTIAAEGPSPPTGDIVAPAAGIAAGQWVGLGPGNIGGRVRAILIDPSNTNSIWLGSVSGGIWHSTDGGASWGAVNDFMGNLSVSSLVMAPNNPNVIYAGTGEGFYNGDAVRGAGVFKSTDGGVTWSQLAATTPSSDVNSDAYNWFYVNRLAMAGDGSAILAATRGYYSNSGGIYRSTDGGATWSLVYSGVMAWDIHYDPNDPGKAVASATTYNSSLGQWQSFLLKSVDGGRTWSIGGSFVSNSRIELAYARSNSQTVYASRENAGGEVWKSVDGGGSWSKVSTPLHLGSQGWYDNTIWVDPTDASQLVIGGLDLWRSTNGGVNWTRISNWVNNMYNGYPNVPHADHHVLVADPNYNGTTNRKLYNANDGGVFRAADISLATETGGWQTLNNGLAVTQFYSAAGHAAGGGRIIGGTQDNGSLLKSATGTDWQAFYGGDGGFSATDGLNDNYLYGEYVYLQLHRSTNGGATASSIYSGIADAGSSSAANFIAPFVLDPNDNNRMLAGGASLWQSLTVKSPVPAWSAIKASVGSNISAIAVAEGNSAIVWVGYTNGKVYHTSNGLTATPTWTQVGAASLPARMVNRIVIDRDDPNRVYAAFGGYNANNLYRTADNGLTWTNITGNLPSVPIFTIVRHPTNASWLYAGTEVGLFTSQDGGANWYTNSDGPANVEISELTWLDDSTLLAATHGRGMFKATVNLVPDTTPPTVTATTPVAGASGTGINGPISVTFSEPMDASTIKSASFTLDHGVTGTVGYDGATMTATFTPAANLTYSTTYTATITTAVKDLAGNPLAQAKTWSFTTMAQPPLDESFAAGALPAGWTVVDNAGSGKVWRFDNPGLRTNNTGGAGSFAIADSDNAGSVNMNTELRSPAFDLTTYSSVTLAFKTDFYYYSGEIADVDVSVNGAAGPWTNVWRKTAGYRGPRSELVDISALAAGKANVMVRFHYYNANYAWYWQVDSVTVSGTQVPPVRLLSPAPTGYQTLQAAYDSAPTGSVIQALAAPFNEYLDFANDVIVALRGGFDPGYTGNSGGYSTLTGTLRVRNGTVKIENFRFR
jgi:Bacterial Ig-like domain